MNSWRCIEITMTFWIKAKIFRIDSRNGSVDDWLVFGNSTRFDYQFTEFCYYLFFRASWASVAILYNESNVERPVCLAIP